MRRIASHGIGVERTFLIHSPRIDKIEVTRRGNVRRAKLYYLRGLTGRAARIKESGRRLPARPTQAPGRLAGRFCVPGHLQLALLHRVVPSATEVGAIDERWQWPVTRPSARPASAPDLRWERAFWRAGLPRVAGVDEVGRGAMAGPLVAAAVVFPASEGWALAGCGRRLRACGTRSC